MKKNSRSGFVALLSVIIMSAVVLVMIFTLGTGVFFSRFSVLENENKRISSGLAEACANTAILKIAQNDSYAPAVGGECVSVSDTCGASDAIMICQICSVHLSGSIYTVRSRAEYKGSFTTLQVQGVMGPASFTLSAWSEIPAYTGSICPLP